MSRISKWLKAGCALGAAAAAVSLLGACSAAKMGAAAMVGGQRITTDDLNGAVTEWQKAYNANPLPSSELRLLDTSSIPRSVLYNLVVFKLADEAAKRQGVGVSDGSVDKAIAAVGGESRVADEAVVMGVPPERARDYARFQLDLQGIAGALGPRPKSMAEQQKIQAGLSKVMRTTARSMKIDVNPRYGRFDYSQLAIATDSDRLSRPESPELPAQG
ncbi:MAG TPA: SurA N-terminal domain-containing protein [Streptosporangiaceae bacterium]